jgi:hypothetical protein
MCRKDPHETDPWEVSAPSEHRESSSSMGYPWHPVPLRALPAAQGPVPEMWAVPGDPTVVADRERPALKHASRVATIAGAVAVMMFAASRTAGRMAVFATTVAPVQASSEHASFVHRKLPAPHRQQSNNETSRPYCFTLLWLTPSCSADVLSLIYEQARLRFTRISLLWQVCIHACLACHCRRLSNTSYIL